MRRPLNREAPTSPSAAGGGVVTYLSDCLAREKRPYIAWHFILTAYEVDLNIQNKRRFRSKRGEYLDTKNAIRDALKRDGEVVSE